MSVDPLLVVCALSKRFGGLLAVDTANLVVEPGSITGLIGPNGAGKTTLFAMVAGAERPSAGSISFAGQPIDALPPHRRARVGIARTAQITQTFSRLTVRDNIAVGAYLRIASREGAIAEAERVAALIGLQPMLNAQGSDLTVSGRKRLELARALATRPRLLLLDEILAGLNPSEIRAILPVIRAIRDSGVTILMVEHVMQAVMSLCETIYVLARGKIIAHGDPLAVTSDPAVIEAYLGKRAAERLQRTQGGVTSTGLPEAVHG